MSQTAVEQSVVDLTARFDRFEVDVWMTIDKLRDRLPVWATLLLSVLTFALGVAAHAALRRGG